MDPALPSILLWLQCTRDSYALEIMRLFDCASRAISYWGLQVPAVLKSGQSGIIVELQRQFLALRRAGALPLQARLERRSLSSFALLTHRELSFVFSLGASLPLFLPNQATL